MAEAAEGAVGAAVGACRKTKPKPFARRLAQPERVTTPADPSAVGVTITRMKRKSKRKRER